MQGEVFFTSQFSVVGMFILQLFRGEGESRLSGTSPTEREKNR
jgi:hypothetical protein